MRHISAPAVTEVPVLVVHKLEVRQGELFFQQFGELVLNGLCPFANQDNKLIYVPSNTPPRDLSVVALKLRWLMGCLGAEVLLRPNLAVQLRIVDEGHTILGCLLHHLGCDLLLVHPKEAVLLGVILEYYDARHLLIADLHGGHLSLMVLF